MEVRTVEQSHGAIRHDIEFDGSADPHWFDAACWQADGAAIESLTAGRGGTVLIRSGPKSLVLRPYRRGGWARRITRDRYLYRNADATRGFREFDLLAQLNENGLLVPRPVAARYLRSGLFYQADLLMHAIPDSVTLGRAISDADLVEWRSVGRSVGELHRRGVWHADLNAHNILVDSARRVWIIDFDRARQRSADARWQQGNLARLRRSLVKLGHEQVADAHWHELIEGHRQAMA